MVRSQGKDHHKSLTVQASRPGAHRGRVCDRQASAGAVSPVFVWTGRLSCWQTPAMPCITQQTDSGVQHEIVVQVDEQAFPAGQTPSPGPHMLPLAHAESRVP